MLPESKMNCLFCSIIKGKTPCHKLFETEKSLAFLDINPLNRGHFLVIPKEHQQQLHQLTDSSLMDLLPVVKKVVKSVGSENYNVLQNNGRLAHQIVDHVHFHIIPKSESLGLGLTWKVIQQDDLDLEAIAKRIVEGIEK